MTNQHSNTSVAENGLSEAAIDGLLKDFFRFEVPLALNKPPALRTAPVIPAMSIHPRHTAPRIAIIAALASLAACLLLTISTKPTSPVNFGVAERTQTPVAPQQELMPVSSNPNTTATAVPVDENGLLLRETEEIQLNPTP
jgi:hypothetical protein